MLYNVNLIAIRCLWEEVAHSLREVLEKECTRGSVSQILYFFFVLILVLLIELVHETYSGTVKRSEIVIQVPMSGYRSPCSKRIPGGSVMHCIH